MFCISNKSLPTTSFCHNTLVHIFLRNLQCCLRASPLSDATSILLCTTSHGKMSTLTRSNSPAIWPYLIQFQSCSRMKSTFVHSRFIQGFYSHEPVETAVIFANTIIRPFLTLRNLQLHETRLMRDCLVDRLNELPSVCTALVQIYQEHDIWLECYLRTPCVVFSMAISKISGDAAHFRSGVTWYGDILNTKFLSLTFSY